MGLLDSPDAVHLTWTKSQILSQSRALFGPLHPHGSIFDLILTSFSTTIKPSRHHQTERTTLHVAYVIVYEIPNSSVNWKTVLGGGEKSTVGKCLDDLLRVLKERLGAVMAPKKTENLEIEKDIEELYGVKDGPVGARRGRFV